MKISEKLMMDKEGLIKNGPITIVAFGDSVTHGALAGGEINYETVYWNRLKQKLNNVRSYVPVNVINAGIGGESATGSLSRMDSQVLAHNPDLVIICFGLNDVNREKSNYLSALAGMFEKCKAACVDAIFMTPNMLNTRVADDTEARYLEYAHKTADIQNSGRMDEFMSDACHLAEKMGITVCDCYSEWKKMSLTEDTTLLLANRINHPTSEMHDLFANALYEMLISDAQADESRESTMYQERN